MCKNPPLTKRFLKNLSGKLEGYKVKFEVSGCTSINLYFQDESRFGLLTVLRRMITAKGVKPVAPFLHRFDNLYLFGAFSPITGDNHLLEMPHATAIPFRSLLIIYPGKGHQNLKYSYWITELFIMQNHLSYQPIWLSFSCHLTVLNSTPLKKSGVILKTG